MAINSKGIANPKNAHIKKSAEGKSKDYILLEQFKLADKNTKEGIKARNDAVIALMDEWSAAIEGSKRKLIELSQGHPTVLDSDLIENYKYDCYEHIVMGLESMDLKRIQHMTGSWTAYIRIVQYCAAYNRSIINKYCGGMPKEKPLEILRPSKKEEIGSISVKIGNKTKNFIKVKSFETLRTGDILRDSEKRIFKYDPDFVYQRDRNGKVVSVVDSDGTVLFKNVNKGIRKLDATNVRSEWTYDKDGKEVTVFDTDKVGYSSVEEQFERAEESKVLREAIAKAYAKFSGLQQNIWNNRLTQSSEQYNKKLRDGKSSIELDTPTKPKFEELGKMCGVTSAEVKSNMNAMRMMIALEIEAANRKYHTEVRF